MARKTTPAKARRKVKPQGAKGQTEKGKSGTKVQRPGKTSRKFSRGKPPLKHTQGESQWGQRDGGQPSSLEEETLDPASPYNKTHGRSRKSK